MIFEFDLSIYALLILLVIYFSMRKDNVFFEYRFRLFRMLIMVVALIIIFEVATEYLTMNYLDNTLMFILIGNAIGFAVSPLAAILWYNYVLMLIYKDLEVLKNHVKLWSGLIIINAVVSFLSISTGWYFSIDGTLGYTRGPLYFIHAGILYLFLALTCILIIKNRRLIRHMDYLSLLFFIIPPTLASVLQIMNLGLLIIWPSVVFSILIAFINVQNRNMEIDYLSGVHSKKQFDNFLDNLVRRSHKRDMIGFMLDIDNFKLINDTYGHDVGDVVIREIGQILKETFRTNDFIARIGGDEFAVIASLRKEDYHVLIARLENHLKQFKVHTQLNFDVFLSVGIIVYDKDKHKTKEAFFNDMDQAMYQNKQQKKMWIHSDG